MSLPDKITEETFKNYTLDNSDHPIVRVINVTASQTDIRYLMTKLFPNQKKEEEKLSFGCAEDFFLFFKYIYEWDINLFFNEPIYNNGFEITGGVDKLIIEFDYVDFSNVDNQTHHNIIKTHKRLKSLYEYNNRPRFKKRKKRTRGPKPRQRRKGG